jgi:hypothetical protein
VRERALVGIALGAVAAFWLAAARTHAAFDYGESDTATWIWLLRHGCALYGDPAGLPMLKSNYPPLELAAVARLTPTDGGILLTGRLLSLAGLALAAAMVGDSARAATGSWRAGAWAAALFLATWRAGYHGMVCRGDSLALGLGAVAVNLAARRVRGWPVAAAALFVLAALTKHSLIVFPIALSSWALAREPRRALVLVPLTFGGIALAVWRLGLAAPLFAWSRAPWSARNFGLVFALAVAPSMFGLALALAAAARSRRFSTEARAVLEPWIVVLIVGVGWIFALGRRGSSLNYVLELCAAIAVIAVVAARAGAFRRLFCLHLVYTAVESVVWSAWLIAQVIPRAEARQRAAAAALAEVPGPVVAEETWTVTALGRPPIVIPFLAAQLARAGAWDASPLEVSLVRGEVARLLLTFSLDDATRAQGHDDRFTPSEQAAMRARYRLVSHAERGLFVYAPR